MAGPTAPLVAAATALSVLAVLYTTSRNKDSSGRLTGLAGLSATNGTSMHSGLNVRPVSYRRTRESATPDEQSKAAELAVHWAFS
ncbi:hypothetical protein HDU87_004944 [Geranomyces variabilis]|uniref:Uncharacterized protein n=1 Tax=Geranomyces variabilis TaxID=109894 RepID=A0AAD5XM21_9FUNG|nr:hypothetical protein HDU87_004944 [Geranomyces variabilis]